MALKRVDERLSRLTSMVEKWNKCGDVPRIERDMALEELRRIYDELLDYTPQQGAEPAVEVREADANETIEDNAEPEVEEAEEEVVTVVAPAVVAAHEDLGDDFDDALDIDALLGLSGEDSIEENASIEPAAEPEPEVVVEPEPAVEAEPAVEPEPDQVMEEAIEETENVEEEKSSERPAGGGLFDIDDIPVRAKSGRKMISLYDAPIKPRTTVKEVEPVAEPVVEAEPAPAPVAAPAPQPVVVSCEEETPQRLGDVIAKNVTTLADKMAEEQPTTAFNRITDIRKAIGLNDKFLMIRDLFGGDATLYEQTITRLNEFDDLDECMIYIVENFRWNPDSEGAKLLVSLIERKLS